MQQVVFEERRSNSAARFVFKGFCVASQLMYPWQYRMFSIQEKVAEYARVKEELLRAKRAVLVLTGDDADKVPP
jgi:hypothetical protein